MKLLISSCFLVGLFLNVRGFSQVAQSGVYQSSANGAQQYGPQPVQPGGGLPPPPGYNGGGLPPPPPGPPGYGAGPAPAPGGYGSNGGSNNGGYNPPPYNPPQPSASCSSSALSLGLPTCQMDANCYDNTPECAIANGVMFQRTTGGSCGDCLAACSNNQAPTSPYICRAATYDYNWQICDLFSVNGTSSPQLLTQYAGRDYFKFKSNPGCAGAGPAPTGAPTPSGTEVCPAGQVTKFAKVKDFAGTAAPNPVASATTADACRQSCLSQGAGCQAYQFGGGACATFSTPYSTDTDVASTPGTDYYSRVCVPQAQAQAVPGDLQIVPNNVLVGFVQEVHDATSLSDCISQCLAASTFCKSGMFYPTDTTPTQNCLLNSDTKDTQPTVFVPESPGVSMSYFQLTSTRKNAKFNLVFRDQSESLEAEGQRWTSWGSTCSQGYQYRYLRCKQTDIRKCPKQTRECETTTVRPLTELQENYKKQIEEEKKAGNGTCLAVRDQHGEKHCPHGAKTLPNGRRTYCTPPEDCPTQN